MGIPGDVGLLQALGAESDSAQHGGGSGRIRDRVRDRTGSSAHNADHQLLGRFECGFVAEHGNQVVGPTRPGKSPTGECVGASGFASDPATGISLTSTAQAEADVPYSWI